MPRKSQFGDLERAVLEILWAQPEDSWLTVREVHTHLGSEREIAYTTVMTVMDRLSRKDQVVQRRDGRAYTYRPRLSRAEMTAEIMRGTLDDFARDDERTSALVAFVDDASPDEVAALRAALAKLEGA